MDPGDKYDKNPIVILRDEGVMGVVIEYGTYVSLVRYMFEGHLIEEVRENEDFVIIDNILIKHIEED